MGYFEDNSARLEEKAWRAVDLALDSADPQQALKAAKLALDRTRPTKRAVEHQGNVNPTFIIVSAVEQARALKEGRVALPVADEVLSDE